MGRYDPFLQALMSGQNQALQLRRESLGQPRGVEKFMSGLRSGQDQLEQRKQAKLQEMLNQSLVKQREQKAMQDAEDREYEISQRPTRERSALTDILFKEAQASQMSAPKPPQGAMTEYQRERLALERQRLDQPDTSRPQTGRWVQLQGEPGAQARRMNTLTGEVEYITQGTDPVLKPSKQVTPQVNNSIMGNENSKREIDQALAALETAGNSVGITPGGVLPDAVAQRVDPGGVKVRGLISKIAAVKIHDLTGSAQTVAEVARLRPFLPSTTDSPTVIKQKLEMLKGEIENMLTMARRAYSQEQGYRQGGLSDEGGKPTSKTGPGGKTYYLWPDGKYHSTMPK